MRLFNPYSYESIHLIIVLIITLLYSLSIARYRNANQLLNRKHYNLLVIVYAFLFVIVVGLRPLHGAFGDMVTVAKTYQLFRLSPISIVGTQDALFYYFQWACAQVMDVQWFFLICEVLYVVPIIIACIRLLKNNAGLGLLFFLAAFSFFSYATNGVRNGIATSLIVLAISLVRGGTFEKIMCIVISLIAVNIHNSVSLPVISMLACYIFKPKKALFYFWVASIFVSILFGSSVSNVFANLGFDDRLNEYITVDIDEDMFSRTGFRWDFLLYSSAPVIFGYYILFKKKVCDPTYLLILGTYILSNSFWIMVIRAAYSNRFAFLSWFLYPLVLAYPLLRLKIWPKSQGNKTALVMMAHLAFTLIMVFIIK